MSGRYASVLFTTASQAEVLFNVYEDVKFISELFDNSETFKQFTENAGVGTREIKIFIQSLQSMGTFDAVTIRFLEVLGDNKRFMFIKDICDKYVKLY